MVLAGGPLNHALQIDPLKVIFRDEWPFAPDGPVRVELFGSELSLEFARGVPVHAQPTCLTEWPWRWLVAWIVFVTLIVSAYSAWQRLRRDRRRAQELLRIGQVGRLNALGELAAGMAHELNQPLSAALVSAQAARRLLAEVPPELDTARLAVEAAAVQSRRAADVVMRLRRLVEAPDTTKALASVQVADALFAVLELLDPELRQLAVKVEVLGSAPPVLADPVALEQIIFNLLRNALQALADVSAGQRVLTLRLDQIGDQAHLPNYFALDDMRRWPRLLPVALLPTAIAELIDR